MFASSDVYALLVCKTCTTSLGADVAAHKRPWSADAPPIIQPEPGDRAKAVKKNSG
jgi:hypothetical protein